MSKKSLHAAVDRIGPKENAILFVDKADGKIGVHMHIPTPLHHVVDLALRGVRFMIDHVRMGDDDTKAYKS